MASIDRAAARDYAMPVGVSAPKDHSLSKLFGRKKVAIGVVHCPAFPGSPGYDGAAIDTLYDTAMRDAVAYVDGGMHGLIIENHGDIPFLRPADLGPETAAAMAVITDRVRRQINVPLGINVLANAAIQAFAVAKAAGASFIRVNQWANAYVANEGLLDGEAALALRYRSGLKADDIAVFADAHVKHGAHAITVDRTIEELTRDLEFFDADAVIATGQRTGDTATMDELGTVAGATQLPVLVGSGVRPDNVAEILTIADGVIVASALKTGGIWTDPVDRNKVVDFMRAFDSGVSA